MSKSKILAALAIVDTCKQELAIQSLHDNVKYCWSKEQVMQFVHDEMFVAIELDREGESISELVWWMCEIMAEDGPMLETR